MIKFPKEITSELFKYTSPLSVANLKGEIENVLNETKHSNLSSNMTGKFIDKYEFEITPKWKIGPLTTGLLGPLSSNSPTKLNGFIFENEKQETQLNLLVSPNSYFPLLFFVLPIFFVAMIFTSGDDPRNAEIDLLAILLIIVTLVTLSILSSFSKNSLKNRFTKYFSLQELI